MRENWTTDVAESVYAFHCEPATPSSNARSRRRPGHVHPAANIANLVLAVAATRRKDLAVRVALDATRWQLATDLGRETLLLGAAGAMAGLLLADLDCRRPRQLR